jgi:NAD(P)-dependent dehydrogenase (short-subunit alcohol dehydrogenase family)
MTDEIVAARGDRLLSEIPLRRFGDPAEVAGVIRFLCSDDASYVNGQTITIDGGMTNA